MRATNFEFRFRFWLIGAIFGLGFGCYHYDKVNMSEWLGSFVTRTSLDAPPGIRVMRMIFALAALLPVLAALVRTWAGAYLHSSVIHDADLHFENLVADGPYRHLRNPLYLGTILLAVGYAFMARRIGFIVLSVGMTVFACRLILREEAGLRESQGESYRRYCQAVPRLIPALMARVPASGAKPDWRDAFVGEIMMWACAAAMTVFAVMLKPRPFYIILWCGLGFYVLQNWIIHRRNPGV